MIAVSHGAPSELVSARDELLMALGLHGFIITGLRRMSLGADSPHSYEEFWLMSASGELIGSQGPSPDVVRLYFQQKRYSTMEFLSWNRLSTVKPGKDLRSARSE